MLEQHRKNILVLAMFAGEIMLRSGAEVYRVEDTITRICRACRIPYVEVFVTISSIMISLDSKDPTEVPITLIKRIRGFSVNLEKISKINQFSRDFTTTDLSVEEGRKILREINSSKVFPLPLHIVGAAFISGFFCCMLGGGPKDFLYAVICGGLSYGVSLILEWLQMNSYMRIFLCCALVAFLALICCTVDPAGNVDFVIIGSVMMFLPGVAITNAIRDALSSDMLSGAARAMEAFLTAVAIAAGAGMVLGIWSWFGGAV